MAYETGTATDIGDLVDKLFTFATGLTTTPWTENELDIVTKRQGTLTLDDCVITFRWDGSVETDLGLYQSLGWVTASAAHEMTDDAGSGDTSVPISSNRRVNFKNVGPYTAYHFFAGEGDEPYIHVVVEVDSGRFRHFGFGNLIKHGTWTGGEYLYGHHWIDTSSRDQPTSTQHTVGLDCVYTGATDGASLHIEGMDDQTVDEKWAVFTQRNPPAGVDTAGEDRKVVLGGMRGGFWGRYLTWMRYNSVNVHVPLMPIPVIYMDASQAPDTYQWLGNQPDVAVINMHAFSAAQEITVGAETWMVFPWVRKQYLENDTEESWNAGVAYKKIV